MAAYALTKWSKIGSPEEVLAAMETQLETVDAAKVIRLAQVVKRGNETVGLLLYDA